MICGATPLLGGVLIFLLWLVTRWDWLMMAGLFTVFGGVVIFLIGAIALTRFCWLAFHTPDLPRHRLWFSALCCAGLLLSNFPVAGAIIATVVMIKTRYTVTVHNASQQPLYDVRVSGGGCEANLGTIPPIAIVRRSFWIQHDGQLELHAVSGSTTHDKTIDGYVTNGMGGDATVTAKPDGTISVADKGG